MNQGGKVFEKCFETQNFLKMMDFL